MEQCSMGVSIRVGDTVYQGIRPENAEGFFYQEIVRGLMPEVVG